MPQLLLVVIILTFALCMSRKLRAVLLHRNVLHFLRTAFLTGLVLLILAAIGIAAWYWWTVIRLQEQGTHWQDTTIEQDRHPVTPHGGGPVTPTIVQ